MISELLSHARQLSAGQAKKFAAACAHHSWIWRREELPEDRDDRLRRWAPRTGVFLLVALAIAVAIGLYPHHIRGPQHPNVLDQIFQSRTIVVLLRVTLLFVSGFVIMSLLARIWRSEWLSKAGPFEISDVVDLTDDLSAALGEIEANEDDIAELNERLADSELTISDLRAIQADLTADISRLQRALDESNRRTGRMSDLLSGGVDDDDESDDPREG